MPSWLPQSVQPGAIHTHRAVHDISTLSAAPGSPQSVAPENRGDWFEHHGNLNRHPIANTPLESTRMVGQRSDISILGSRNERIVVR